LWPWIPESKPQAGPTPHCPVRRQALLQEFDPIQVLLSDGLIHHRIEQQIRHVIRQRPAYEKFHREVIDTLGIFARVRVFRERPALGKNVPSGAGEGLETIARASAGRVDDVVKKKMPLIQAAIRAGETNRTRAVLLEQLRVFFILLG
jgi:hypothetical protein